jgi:uncharacterized protein
MLADHIGIPHLRELASKNESLQTAVSALDLPRVAELIHPDAAADDQQLSLDIRFQNSSGVDPGYPEIGGNLHVALDLICQRCLGDLRWDAELPLQLVVVDSEAAADELAEPFDSVVADEHGISLLTIVEDELLSSLPLAPMHIDVKICEREGVRWITETETEPDESGEDSNRPFADLKDLLKGSSSGDTD